MNCSEIRENIDDCIDGYLSEIDHKMIIDHIGQCSSCSNIYQRRSDLIQLIASTKSFIPALNHDFNDNFSNKLSHDLTDRIISARNTRKNTNQLKRRNWSVGISAVAASLAILAILPGLNKVTSPTPAIPPMQTRFLLPTLNEPYTIGLMFKSRQLLENVTFSLEIPAEIELKGFSGKQSLQWTGDLQKGKNLISVPVIARSATSGILTMSLKHVKTIKTFKVRLDSNKNDNPKNIDRNNSGLSIRFIENIIT